jgi:two-component system, NarL family, sensor histidine kinase DevS
MAARPLHADELASAARVREELRTAHVEVMRRTAMAAEGERGRWARELHDRTLQSLFGLRLRLIAARQQDDLDGWRRAGDQAVRHIEQEIASLRTIISDVRPPALDELGLYPAIRALAQHHERANGLRVRCELASHEAPRDTELETIIYRIVQEALNNVVKHARAQKVRVAVRVDGAQLVVAIVDDGVGFDQARLARGFGLTGVRERAGMVGGAMTIESGLWGTTLRVVMPIAGVGARSIAKH